MIDYLKYDKYICDIFITPKLKINNNQIRKLNKYPNIKSYLLNRYNDKDTLSIIIWRIYYHIENRPKCGICGKYTPFDFKNKSYKKYCCASCSAKSIERNNKYNQTCLEKYGHINPLHGGIGKIKKIKTWMDKYGVDNPSKSELIKNKSKQTCLKKYGVEYSFQSDNNKNKSKETKLKRYGDKNFINLEKRKQTCLEKYNQEFYFQTDQFKEKSKQTCLEKYGVDNYRKTKENIEKSHLPEAINKCNQTKKENQTYNKSSEEDKSYELLTEKFPDIIRQYRSELYPFNCDFYIPSLNLYIECNYHWTHGGKLYEGTEKDNQLVQKWKDQNTEYYDNAIKTWTYYDVEKNNIAKQNNLNYIIFWNINELKEWIKNL